MANGINTTGNFPKFLWPGIKGIWGTEYNEYVELFSQIFDKVTSTKSYEEYVQLVRFGVAQRKAEGEGVAFDTMQQGFTTRLTNVSYALGSVFTHEEIADDQYMKVMKDRVPALHSAFREAKEVIFANILNRAATAGYVGGDSVTLLNTAHPNSSGGTWANKFTVDADLTEQAIEDMVILMMQARDDRGFVKKLEPMKLIVHPANIANATRIMKSLKQSGTANNDTNAMRELGWFKGGLIVNPYLSSAAPWYIKSDIKAGQGLIHQEREKLFIREDNDIDTLNYKFIGFERYAGGWVDPRCLYGSPTAP